MYFPIGWPKVLRVPHSGRGLRQIKCNRDRILVAILTDNSLEIWFCKPCVPIVYHKRDLKSLEKFGSNITAEWKPDSSKIVIATSEGHLIYYKLNVLTNQKGLYVQTDSPHANLRRDSAELFIKETIPPLSLEISDEVMVWDGQITGIVCITMSEIMLSTSENHILRYRWDGTQSRDYALDLRRIPFCINQQVSKAVPIVEDNIFVTDIEYSPLVGGFSIVLNDGRAAFLTAPSLKFDPNIFCKQVQGIWAQNIEDATCTTINHKFRLITFGRANAECIVYYVDDSTGGLEVSHNCLLGSKDYPGCPGSVQDVLWTPDGSALVASWSKGGIAMWSTFGALLVCSLGWDYGLNVDIQKGNPLKISSMDFATEGYQLWMIRENEWENENGNKTDNESTLVQLDFVKSALTINPCMSHQSHLYLQGDDRLYVNSSDNLIKTFADRSNRDDPLFGDNVPFTTTLAEGRQWLVIPVPSTYSATNWPIRYSAIDIEGQNIAVAGRTGMAHYSMITRRWKLFGNESQEKDFIVAGGLLWWRDYVVLGCYSIVDNADGIRFYSRDSKLDNKFAKMVSVNAPILLMNVLEDQLITFGSDAQINIWQLRQNDSVGDVNITKLQSIDVSALAVHPACIVSVTLTALGTEGTVKNSLKAVESMVLNISGRLVLVQREKRNGEKFACLMPTVLASCVENVWVPAKRTQDKAHLTEVLWLFCGSHGMRVWLPLYPRGGDKQHSFMSKRIMLPFQLKIYPLAILFEDAIILGAENDTVLYSSDVHSPFSLPFTVLQRTSQVYLHQILRQLIRRNLGYHAWEIAKSCMSLPYFPHSLELLLHEVLEEEATSKEPIPDAQLPSVIEFIMEFPVYLQTVVQCARKTEIALWPYLFSAAGKPKDLFQECMAKNQLDTAASYLIILQNLETSSVSRQYATLLLNTALDQSKWELAKDLVRFLRAIDPNDVESPRNSFILPSKLSNKQTPPVSPNAEEISLVLGNVQGSRVRSYSTTVSPKIAEKPPEKKMNVLPESPKSSRKKSVPNATPDSKNPPTNTAEEFFIDVILQKHARRLLSNRRLTDLGYFAAHLDFHLVVWLAKERDRAARIDDFVTALKQLHDEFQWPYPTSSTLSSPRESVTKIQSPETSSVNPLEEQLRALKLDVFNQPSTSSRVGDSGYMSLQGLPCRLLNPRPSFEQWSGVADDVDLKLDNVKPSTQALKNPTSILANECINLHNASLQTNNPLDESMTSTVSSVWAEENRELTENWEVPATQILEQLSNEDTKGSHRAEIQLRYLLQLFMEAGCLEWSLLISVLLRDAMAVLRTVNAAKSQEQSIESVSRLRQGLLILSYWTNSECLGYRAFMLAIQNQLSVLTRILETKIQHQQIIEYQQAVSATINKVSLQKPRSRNSSQSQDGQTPSSSGSLKKKKNTNSANINARATKSSSEIKVAVAKNDSAEVQMGTDEESVIPESTGCVVS